MEDEEWDAIQEWRSEAESQSGSEEALRPWEKAEVLEEWTLSDEEKEEEEERQAKRRR